MPEEVADLELEVELIKEAEVEVDLVVEMEAGVEGAPGAAGEEAEVVAGVA